MLIGGLGRCFLRWSSEFPVWTPRPSTSFCWTSLPPTTTDTSSTTGRGFAGCCRASEGTRKSIIVADSLCFNDLDRFPQSCYTVSPKKKNIAAPRSWYLFLSRKKVQSFFWNQLFKRHKEGFGGYKAIFQRKFVRTERSLRPDCPLKERRRSSAQRNAKIYTFYACVRDSHFFPIVGTTKKLSGER